MYNIRYVTYRRNIPDSLASHLCMQNIFDGVIWFALPVLLVCSNDTFAYIVGFFLGKKFIQQPLTNLSVTIKHFLIFLLMSNF